jgi:predicted nucleic acid-binding protein
MIEDGLVVLPGIIKQELLSGLKTSQHFALVSAKLEYFSYLLATDADHILAARLFNRCQKVGIQGSHVDFLICALAIHNECSIFTTDKDFSNYRKVFEINIKVVSP